MSGAFSAVGKVFKKVAKVVKKVALPALMIGAVVLTGGAALGALPAIGTVLGSVGISGTLASVLGGAISMGAVGAVTGGLKAGITGGSIMKGATGGFVMGAATGGLLGAAGVISPNGILSDMGIGSGASHLQGLQATGTLAKFAPNATAAQLTRAGVPAPAPTVAAPAATTAAPVAPTSVGAAGAQTGGLSQSLAAPVATTTTRAAGGLLAQAGSVPSLLQLGGQVLSGFAQGSAQAQASREEAQAIQDQYDRVARNYGVRNVYETDKKGRSIHGVPIRQEMDYAYAPQELGQPDTGLLASSYRRGVAVPYFQIVGGQVVQVGA